MKHNIKQYISWALTDPLLYFCLILTFCLLSQDLVGQGNVSKWLLSGNLGIYGDFYSLNADTIGAVAPRRPGSMGRFVADASLSYGKFSLPVSIMFTAGQYSVILPKIPRGNLIDFIRDPANRIGIAPKYKWAQLLLGTQVPQYSELSVGDLPVFGAGINLTPGKFRFGVFAGTTQLAIEADSSRHIQGIYARNIYSGKIGVGKEESSHVYLITSFMEDDTSSLRQKPINIMPQKGVLSSLDYKIKFGKQYYMKGEIAGSAFTRDTRSKEGAFFESPVNIPTGIYKIQESSRINFASVLSIAKEGKVFSLKLMGKYLGDGFVPMGYPFMQTDRAEVTIDPSLNLFKSKVQLSGSIGKRIDNLSRARATTTTQTIVSANLNYQITERFSLSGSFSNFGFRNPLVNDTLRIEMVTLSWSASPVYSYTTGSSIHVFSAMYSQNTFKDFNTISGELNDNDSRCAVVSYMLSKIKIPLNLSGTVSYFDNNTSFGMFAVKSLNLGIGYKFAKKKLNATTGITLTESKVGANAGGRQLMTTLGLKYSVKKKLNFAVTGSINIFKYGVDRPDISYHENLLRTSITYKF